MQSLVEVKCLHWKGSVHALVHVYQVMDHRLKKFVKTGESGLIRLWFVWVWFICTRKFLFIVSQVSSRKLKMSGLHESCFSQWNGGRGLYRINIDLPHDLPPSLATGFEFAAKLYSMEYGRTLHPWMVEWLHCCIVVCVGVENKMTVRADWIDSYHTGGRKNNYLLLAVRSTAKLVVKISHTFTISGAIVCLEWMNKS